MRPHHRLPLVFTPPSPSRLPLATTPPSPSRCLTRLHHRPIVGPCCTTPIAAAPPLSPPHPPCRRSTPYTTVLSLVAAVAPSLSPVVVADLVSWNFMLSGYAGCSDIVEAHKMFDQMLERDVVFWSIMINGYDKHYVALMTIVSSPMTSAGGFLH
ncbi:Pentatricopeptide repeat-containing protein [Cynara cardunculus var. scolymus]|uniref:Pentatricopeptide repeat-containing protein n=1 Tax=Cynara cardunculus var. scolymus TaxID=59895 RepID=A0A124SGM0_CYNCS|nr:Pentatricopeptide repeat-containing protein [Cynara cardunculus var. scolymus]